MADDTAGFLQEVEKLSLGYLKVSPLLLLSTDMRPEEIPAIRVGNIVSNGSDTSSASQARSTAMERPSRTIPKSNARQRSVTIDNHTVDAVRT